MRVGVATSEPEVADDGGAEFWWRFGQLQLDEVRLVAYRNNPELLDRIRRTLLLAPAGVKASLVLIDGPGEDLRGFPDWAATVIRVLPRVYRAIVWNEPDSHVFWPHPRGGTIEERARTYARFLNETTAALHDARQDLVVSGYGLTSSHRPVAFLKAGQLAGARLTSLSAHLYPGNPSDGVRGSVALLRRLEAVVPGVPVYVDEYGWNAGPACSEQRQAALYRQLLDTLRLDRRVKCALVYRLEDGEGWTAGPFRATGARRPCWQTLHAAATRALV